MDSNVYTVLSFIKTTKYPPSLAFTLMTLGPALVFLSLIESVKTKVIWALHIIGRVPLFYYILHLYIIHLIGMIGLLVLGEDWRELVLTVDRFKSGYLYTIGFDLWVSYVTWILVVVLLYPACKIYARYKTNNPHKWWLSYL